MPRRDDFYVLLIVLFSLLCGLQFLTGLALYLTKLGWTPSGAAAFYLGDSSDFSVKKTWTGLIETAIPHLIAIGTTGFILSHFLMFVPDLKPRAKWLLGLGVPVWGLLDIVSGFLIVYVSELFALFKLVSFIGFELSLFGTLGVLVASGLKRSRKTTFSAK